MFHFSRAFLIFSLFICLNFFPFSFVFPFAASFVKHNALTSLETQENGSTVCNGRNLYFNVQSWKSNVQKYHRVKQGVYHWRKNLKVRIAARITARTHVARKNKFTSTKDNTKLFSENWENNNIRITQITKVALLLLNGRRRWDDPSLRQLKYSEVYSYKDHLTVNTRNENPLPLTADQKRVRGGGEGRDNVPKLAP